MNRTKFFLVTLVVHFQLFIFNSAFSQKWSLDQCIDSAIQNNLTLKKTVLTTQIADVTLKNSKENLLPSLNSSAVHGYNWGQTIDPFTNQFATNRVQYNNFFLSSSLVLFSGLQNYYTIKANEISSTQSQLARDIAERNLKIEVSAAFLQVVLNESILELSENNLERTKLQLERIEALRAEKQATIFDVSEVEAQLSLDTYEVIKSKNDVSYSKLLLRQIMNVNLDDFELEENFKSLFDIELKGINDSIIYSLPELLSFQLGVEKQLMLLKTAKGRYYPSLLLSGSLGSGYSGNNNDFLPDGSLAPKPFGRQLNENFYQSAQVILSIPLFNKNATSNQVRIAEYEIETQSLEQQNQYNLTKQKLEQLSLNVSNENEQYNALQKVNETATLNYDNFKIRFEQGDVSFNQLIEVQNKLFGATFQMIQSEFQLKFKATVLGFYF